MSKNWDGVEPPKSASEPKPDVEDGRSEREIMNWILTIDLLLNTLAVIKVDMEDYASR
jgi:hypothetical protein